GPGLNNNRRNSLSVVRGEPASIDDAIPAGMARDVVSFESEPLAPDRGDRLVAALAYLGILSHLLLLMSPGRRFVQRHQQLAAIIHTIRLIWLALVLGIWWGFFVDGDRNERLTSLAVDTLLVLLTGIPLPSTLSGEF